MDNITRIPQDARGAGVWKDAKIIARAWDTFGPRRLFWLWITPGILGVRDLQQDPLRVLSDGIFGKIHYGFLDALMAGLAVLGGSFDPVHLGHLWMAETALEQLPIDHVRWFPAATSPLKPHGPVASNDQRWRMLQLATAGAPGHVLDDWELKRDDVSYTVQTLRHLWATLPEHDLYLVIGADSLASFARWSEPAEILQLCLPAVVHRGGDPPPDYNVLAPFASPDRIAMIRKLELTMPAIELSSSDLRSRVAHGKSIRFRVPHAVAALIESEALYRAPVDSPKS